MKVTKVRMDPPKWYPKEINVPKTPGFVHTKEFAARKSVKGRVRISALQYVSPSRKSRYKHPMWRVRYNRKGIVFEATYRSRELCGYLASLVHQAADPELCQGRVIPNRFCTYPHEVRGLTGPSKVWVFGSIPQIIVLADPHLLEKFPPVPWFSVWGKGVALSPVVTLTEKRKIEVSWLNLEQELFPDSWDQRYEKERPKENMEGQIVVNRTYANFLKRKA